MVGGEQEEQVEGEVIGDTVGVALSGGAVAAVLVRAVQRHDALDETWCSKNVRQQTTTSSGRFVPWAAAAAAAPSGGAVATPGPVVVYRVARIASDELAGRLVASSEATATARGGWST